MNELTIKPSLESRLWLVVAVLAMGSFPIIWVFAVGEGSRIALGIALLIPIIVDLYTSYRFVIRIKEGKIYYRSIFLYTHKPVSIASIFKIELYRSTKMSYLNLSLLGELNRIISTAPYGIDQIADIIIALKAKNPQIAVTQELQTLVDVYEDKEKFKNRVNELERAATNKALCGIAIAGATVFCFWFFKLLSGEPYTLRDLADLFVGIIN